MKKRCILLLLLVVVFEIEAQETAIYSLSTRNILAVNAAGIISGNQNIELISRQQWLGLSGAPSIAMFAYQPKITYKSNVSAIAFADKSGSVSNIGIKASYIYRINLGGTQAFSKRLSFALSASFLQQQIGTFDFLDNRDPALNGSTLLDISANTDAAVFFSARYFYTGISAHNLLPHLSIYKNSTIFFRENRTVVFGTFGSGFNLNTSTRVRFEVQPVYFVKNSEFTASAMLEACYMDKFFVGMGIQTLTDAVAIAGVKLGQYRISYGFDWGYARINTKGFGSHSVSVRHIFKSQRGMVECPAY